jgi:hypothetical protein
VHNKAQGRIGYGGLYTFRFAGEVLDISVTLDRAHKGYEKDRGKGESAGVSSFSEKSRRRLAKACASVDWSAMPFLFVTLTYPREHPDDGVVCRRHLEAFRKRWQRKYGAPVGVWKREFQRRGAVHYHLALLAPVNVHLRVVRKWVAEAWFDIVKSGDTRHLSAGTQVDPMDRPPIAYFACHGQHGRDKKGYQNEIPEGFKNAGRFWGLWNLAPMWEEELLTATEFVQARRIMRAWARSKGLQLRKNGGRVQGMWLRTPGRPALTLAADVRRAVVLCST